jgi:hypothetical protein
VASVIREPGAIPPPVGVPPEEAATASAFAIDPPTLHGDISFSFKVVATGRRYRLEPARWPGQPRLWGFRIFRCNAGNMPDPTERAWFGAGGMTREDLAAAALAIRTDIDGWLARTEHAELRSWVVESST